MDTIFYRSTAMNQIIHTIDQLKKIFFSIIYHGGPITHHDHAKVKDQAYKNRVFPIDVFGIPSIYNSVTETIPALGHITFKNQNFGCTQNDFLSSAKKPNHISQSDINGACYSQLFYLEQISGHDVIGQAHFLNGNFIYGCFSFSELSTKDKLQIKRALIEKWGNTSGSYRFYDGLQISITDSKQNKIVIAEDVRLRICYITGDQKFHAMINKLRKKTETQNQLIKRELYYSL